MWRRLFSLFIASCAYAVAAPPAMADSGSIHGHVITGDFSRFHPQAPRLRLFHHRHHFACSSDFLLPFGFLQAGSVFPPDAFDGIDSIDPLALASGRPPTMIVAPDSAAPRRVSGSAADERASIETTPQGVVIVRGPGSRHLER